MLSHANMGALCTAARFPSSVVLLLECVDQMLAEISFRNVSQCTER